MPSGGYQTADADSVWFRCQASDRIDRGKQKQTISIILLAAVLGNEKSSLTGHQILKS